MTDLDWLEAIKQGTVSVPPEVVIRLLKSFAEDCVNTVGNYPKIKYIAEKWGIEL